MKWQCPDCGRRFVQRTREHSCEVTSIEKHLARASPDTREAFHALHAMLRKLGTFQLIAVKTMIILSARSNFGGITVRKAKLDVGFFLARVENDSRIVRVEQISPRKIAHHVDLTSANDVDKQLESWFREAFEINRQR